MHADHNRPHQGVSYLVPKIGAVIEPPVIQNWPEQESKVSNKVPTVIAFTETIVTWGFQITQSKRDNPRTRVEEHFKLLLDQKILDEVNTEPTAQLTMGQVQGWFETFLKMLYDWTTEQLKGLKVIEKPLQGASVEFIFSVPTTWEEETVSDYHRVIQKAGFGTVLGHSAEIGLNEAEAAAVHTAIYNATEDTDGYKV
jgi:hypothetical protein